jgi:hypothetical protein
VRYKVLFPDENHYGTCTPTTLLRFCQTCGEAAVKSLRILAFLKRSSIIGEKSPKCEHSICSVSNQAARFGFFDLDATFSAAFITVMIGLIDGDQSELPPKGLHEAYEVFRYLSGSGNKAAGRRLEDIKQICSHVWPGNMAVLPQGMVVESSSIRPSRQPPETRLQAVMPGPSSTTGTYDDQATIRFEHSKAGNLRVGPLEQPSAPEAAMNLDSNLCQDDSGLLGDWELKALMATFDHNNNMETSAAQVTDELYFSFNDPNLPLTGRDYLDWAEMERILTSRTF